MPVVVRSHRRLVLAYAVLAVLLGVGALISTGGLAVAVVSSTGSGSVGSGPVLVVGGLAGTLAMAAMLMVLFGVVARRSDHQRLTEALRSGGFGAADVGRLWSGRPAPTECGVVLHPVRSRGHLELRAEPPREQE